MATMLSEDQLSRFRETQQLAYRCAETVAAQLREGDTERDTARRMREWLHDNGIRDFFHIPFAWFGDRTAFRGFKVPTQFFPSKRRLEPGMPFILDCAPVRDGFTADIGYSGSLGPNPTVEKMQQDLKGHRELIVEQVRAGTTLQEIYRKVDTLIAAQGYDNRHRVYPGRVLAHQVGTVRSKLPATTFAGFGIRSLQTLGRELVKERFRHRSPLWADGRASAHPATPGLWAVEPHLGLGPVGVKFEELLVVTGDDAFWLDDDLPHVRRWAA